MSPLRKGLALSILWAEMPAPSPTSLETWAASAPIADFDPASGVLSVGRYAAVSGGPAFVEVYELESEKAANSADSARLLDGTRRQLQQTGAIAVAHGVYTQIFPPALDERNSLHGPPPALQIGRIGIPPEHEEEFNEWYNTEYLVGYLRVPGVYSARRYTNIAGKPRYLTVYELAHAEVSRQPDWDRVRAQSVWRRRIERFWTHDKGSPGIYRRLAAR